MEFCSWHRVRTRGAGRARGMDMARGRFRGRRGARGRARVPKSDFPPF